MEEREDMKTHRTKLEGELQQVQPNMLDFAASLS
jgi:hypothetical protein